MPIVIRYNRQRHYTAQEICPRCKHERQLTTKEIRSYRGRLSLASRRTKSRQPKTPA